MLFSKKNGAGKSAKDQITRIVIEMTPEQKERWKKAADKRGLSLAAFVIGCVNAVVHKGE